MIWTERSCIVLGPDDQEGGVYVWWNDDADAEAMAVGGRVVQLNSDPEHLFSDFRPGATGRAAEAAEQYRRDVGAADTIARMAQHM
jgi:hypothetical protein